MEEKKLTDEEIISAYAYCLIINNDCKNCPYNGWGCEIGAKDIFDIVNRQKAEIERLTRELNDTVSMNEMYVEKTRQNAELQKQVDELKESANGHLLTILYKKQADDHKRAISVQRTHYEKKVQQAVKNTAKEIYERIIELSENPCNDREEIYKEVFGKYGVEVE